MTTSTTIPIMTGILFITSALTAGLTTRIEPWGSRVKPNWVSNYKPKFWMLAALSALFTAATTVALCYNSNSGFSAAQLISEIPEAQQSILLAIMLGTTLGITSAATLQDIKDKTVPSISIVTFAIPVVAILQFTIQGIQWFNSLGSTIVEMLLIWGTVYIWEYLQWKKGSQFNQLETPEEFRIYRKFGKWRASIGGADEPLWIDLAPSKSRAGIIAITPEGRKIEGYRNEVAVTGPEGTQIHILENTREDLSFEISQVKLPKQAMGRGDMHLACLFGLTLGPATALITICVGGILTIIGAFLGKKNLSEEMPMIPGMAIAFIGILPFLPVIRETSEAIIYLVR